MFRNIPKKIIWKSFSKGTKWSFLIIMGAVSHLMGCKEKHLRRNSVQFFHFISPISSVFVDSWALVKTYSRENKNSCYRVKNKI